MGETPNFFSEKSKGYANELTVMKVFSLFFITSYAAGKMQ
jgi:hypothetical protein